MPGGRSEQLVRVSIHGKHQKQVGPNAPGNIRVFLPCERFDRNSCVSGEFRTVALQVHANVRALGADSIELYG